MKEEKIIEKWEKESYEKGWRDGRKELIKEIDKILSKPQGLESMTIALEKLKSDLR